MKLSFLFRFLFVVMFSCNIFYVKADEFVVISFKHRPEVTAAREKVMVDVNDRKCALIIIKTDVDLNNANFDANPMVCGNIKVDHGEWWVYVAPGSSKLQIKKPNFIPFDFFIPTGITLESMNTYELRITNKEKNLMPEKEKQPEFVKIKSEPAGAKVYLNNEYKGLTPFNAAVLEGEYSWKIEKDKYHIEEGNFTVAIGSPPELNKTLRPKFGTVNIHSEPENGATVIINNKETGKITPFINEQYAGGSYTVTLQKANYYDVTESFSVIEGQETNLKLNMKARFGSITIESEPESDALISIDGVNLNQTTPYTIPKLNSGIHKVEVVKDMYEPTTESFTISDGQTSTITVELKPVYGEVNISTNPKADIYIDKVKAGEGSLINKRLINGTHLLEAKKDKHSDAIKTIVVKTGSKENYTLEPKPKTGTLSVSTTPMEAELFLNGELKGKTPLFIRDLLIGNYNLKIKLSEFSEVTKIVEIKENQITEVNDSLATGEEVIIFTKPAGGIIKIDGGIEQSTPFNGKLAYGQHIITAYLASSKDNSTNTTIKVIKGGNIYFTADIKSDKNLKSTSEDEFEKMSFTDPRDKRVYKSVKIGTQVWMAENLAYSANNSHQRQITDIYEWAFNTKYDGWCYYNNNSAEGEKYGVLYQWEAAMKACPDGWHLPTKEEWNVLINFTGSHAAKIMTEEGWKIKGSNQYGFSAIPIGVRYDNGYFGLNINSDWWTATEKEAEVASFVGLYSDKDVYLTSDYRKKHGFSVRCVKD